MKDRQIENNSKFTVLQCPICNGFGTLSYGKKVCHGCGGRGFIVINNKTGLPVERKKDNERYLDDKR